MRKHLPTALASGALLLALISIAVVVLSGSGVDWGDAPTWVASVATSGALTLSAITLYRNQQDIRRRDIYAQSSQARQILTSSLKAGGGSRTGDEGSIVVDFRVTNESADAIRDVRIEYVVTPSSVLAPTGMRLVAEAETLPPNENLEGPKRVGVTVEAWDSRKFEVDAFVEFTDASGIRWQRDHRYNLKRL